MATAVALLCALIRWFLNPILIHPTLTLLLPAVVFAGFVGGLQLAMVITALCTLLGLVAMWFQPDAQFSGQAIAIETVGFVVVSCAIGLIARKFHHANRRAEEMSVRRASLEVTEKLRAQEEANQQLRHLADTLPHLVWITRPDGSAEFFNRRWYDFTGASEAQSLGNEWSNPLHPDDAERSRSRWELSISTSQSYEIEYRIRRFDGVYRWFVGRGLPLRDEAGTIVKWFGTCTDIDDAKQTQAKMELLKAAVESANDAVIITEAQLDAPGPRIEYVNPAFCSMTGYDPLEILGKTPRILQGPKTDRSLIQRIRSDLRDTQSFHGETVNYRKDGTEYFVEWRITALRDEVGEVMYWVAIQRDVTGRVHNDQTLRQLAADRETLLQSERAARMEQERIGRMKDEFLATLSHELRTPLNAILGWAQILRRPGSNRTPEDASRAIETIHRNAKVQSQLINDLLDMSRIISGKISLNIQKLDLIDTLNAAIASVQHTAEARNIRIVKVFDTNVDPVSAYASRLQQVFWNLLSNAIKFTPRDGRIEVMLRKHHSHVRISICDNGQGIAAEFLPYVFDRFRQADGSMARRHGGLGLGLAIVKQLVESHGGSVHAQSDGVGQGSTFTVSLPLMSITHTRFDRPSSEDEVDRASLAANCVSLKGIKVLVIDDEPDARVLIKRFLEECDAVVVTGESAFRGLELLKGSVPDVIISDIGMPELDGFEFIRRIRALPDDAGGRTPAVALTAFARAEDRQAALRAGYQMHISKPVEVSELIAAIASLAHVTERS